jgi:hypothetical protein
MTPGQWIAGGFGVVFRDGRVWLHHAGNVWTLPLEGWQQFDSLSAWEMVQDAGHLLGQVPGRPRHVQLRSGEAVRVPSVLAIRTQCACTPERHCEVCSGVAVL